MDRVVVVGASLAGTRAAEALRRFGFTGEIHLVGAENRPPYERPPLSKQVLGGKWDFARAAIRLPEGFEATWHLGRAASRLDIGTREVSLDDGSSLHFDGLIIATGAAPRSIPGTEGVRGVFTLRTYDDSVALREAVGIGVSEPLQNGNLREQLPVSPSVTMTAELSGSPQRVAIIGGGFIGCEVAATLAGNGAQCTIVDPVPHLMGRALGNEFAAFFHDLHESNGVRLRLGVGVASVEARDGRALACMLGDGSRLDCDAVVVGIGVSPATDWLGDSEVALDPNDRAVICDATCAVISKSGESLEGVVAAGDVARWDHRLFGRAMRVEHWENAVTMGEAAARRLMSRDGRADPYLDIPFFWSDQWGKKIQFVGLRLPGDDVTIVEGAPGEGKFLALYSRGAILTGALGVGRAARVVAMRHAIAERAPLDEVG